LASADGSLESGSDAVVAGVLMDEPMIFRASGGTAAALRPAADPEFARTDRMHVELGVRQPTIERQARLLRRSGEPLNGAVTVTEREVDGRRMLICDLGLGFLAPAEYLLDISARGGADAERKLIAFRVK
jgi:hypothetical protein